MTSHRRRRGSCRLRGRVRSGPRKGLCRVRSRRRGSKVQPSVFYQPDNVVHTKPLPKEIEHGSHTNIPIQLDEPVNESGETNYCTNLQQAQLQIYNDKRDQFMKACNDNGVNVITGSEKQPIIAYTSPYDGKKSTMLIISGTHGVEGYAGADIQTSIINQPNTYTDINLICIFGLNQWGMRHGQRYTQENIDLNRNMLSEAVENPIYDEKLHKIFLKQIGKTGELSTILSFITQWGVHLKKNSKLVMSGQYKFPCGFEYGGNWATTGNYANEHMYAIKQLKTIITKPVKRMIIWDIHTGVGAPVTKSTGAQDILITDDQAQTTELKSILNDSRNRKRIREGGKGVYHVTGSAMNGYKRTFSRMSDKIVAVTQEFATKNVRDIFISLIQRRSAKALQKLFYIDEEWWKQGVVRRGNELYQDMLSFLK